VSWKMSKFLGGLELGEGELIIGSLKTWFVTEKSVASSCRDFGAGGGRVVYWNSYIRVGVLLEEKERNIFY
jgi:hypothetical protein